MNACQNDRKKTNMHRTHLKLTAPNSSSGELAILLAYDTQTLDIYEKGRHKREWYPRGGGGS